MENLREKFGPYQVLSTIGAGGMGEVFAAHDPRLGRKVAIKILPLRLTDDRDTLSRFTQEARSASALNHPNIVTIYEVGSSDNAPYIVMELIDGRDLRSFIAEGPVPVRQALEIAAQIADGLSAAHERGIIHRDLKPENIMVTRDGYVKILDFGLAKMLSPSAEGDHTQLLELPATNPGTILGTVGYMSPEQATGRPIDSRSDLFAFGAILYELVTGRVAFPGETAIDTLSAILHKEPEPINRLVPGAPMQLSDLIRRLLAKAPDNRYVSTRDLAGELRMLRDRVIAEDSGFHNVKPRTRRATTTAIIASVALALFIGGAFYVARQRAADATPVAAAIAKTPVPATYLAVMGFKDLTGDPKGQVVADGFTETLTARLSHYPNVQVMRPTAEQLKMPDAGKVARDLGANLFLTGSMMRDRDRIRITYSVTNLSAGGEWHDLVEGTSSAIFDAQDRVARSVANNLSLGTASIAVAAIDPAVSQERYLEAIGHLRRYDSDASLDAAIAILKDLGQSAAVQAALASAYLAKFEDKKDPAIAALAREAAEKARAADPQGMDVNVTLGNLLRQTGRYKEATDAFLRVLSQQPTNVEAILGLAETYKGSGELVKAEEQYKKAIEMQPRYWGGYNKLGAFYYKQSRFADAIPQFKKVAELVPDNERGYINLGAMYQQVGRYDEAIDVLRQSIARKPVAPAYSNLGTCYYFLGRFADAAKAYEQALEMNPRSFLYWRNLGDAYRWMPGHENDSRRAFTRTIELCDQVIGVNPSDALAHSVRGIALAKLGRVQEGRAGILRALELAPSDPAYVYEAAVLANIAGATDESLARLEQAIRLGFNPDDVLSDPEFENLEKSGRLRSVVQVRGSKP